MLSKRGDEGFHLFEVKIEGLRLDGAVLKGLIISLCAKYCFQLEVVDSLLLQKVLQLL